MKIIRLTLAVALLVATFAAGEIRQRQADTAELHDAIYHGGGAGAVCGTDAQCAERDRIHQPDGSDLGVINGQVIH